MIMDSVERANIDIEIKGYYERIKDFADRYNRNHKDQWQQMFSWELADLLSLTEELDYKRAVTGLDAEGLRQYRDMVAELWAQLNAEAPHITNQHPYRYEGSNPVRYTGPSGRSNRIYGLTIEEGVSFSDSVNNRIIELIGLKKGKGDQILKNDNTIRQLFGNIDRVRLNFWKEAGVNFLSGVNAALGLTQGDAQSASELLADLSNPQTTAQDVVKNEIEKMPVIARLRRENESLSCEIQEIDKEIQYWEKYQREVLAPLSATE